MYLGGKTRIIDYHKSDQLWEVKVEQFETEIDAQACNVS